MKSLKTLFNSLIVMIIMTGSVSAYTPPIGIPDPAWGSLHAIDTTAPSHPSGWPSSEVAGYYYIDNTHPSATDTGNTYGYPNKPRASFPGDNTFPAGTYIEIHGGPYTSLSTKRISFTCLESTPCWIIGNNSSKPSITNKMEIQDSSYLFIENLSFTGGSGVAIALLARNTEKSHNISFRNIDVTNRDYLSNTGGISIQPLDGGKIYDVVVYNTFMEKLGTNVDWFDPSIDPDFIGVVISGFNRDVAMGTEIYNIFVLDSLFREIGSNAVQVVGQNCKNGSCLDLLHHIYIGRNTTYSNRQSGFWSKQARDVIFSENTSYNNRKHGNQPGDGIGYQYGPDYLWIIFNNLYDSNYGVRQSDTPTGNEGNKVYIIGNTIHDINPEDIATYDPDNNWREGVGISLWQGIVDRYIVDNTIYNTYGGIQAITSGPVEIHGNIISEIHDSDYHISMQIPARENTVTMSKNLFYDAGIGGSSIKWDGKRYSTLTLFNLDTSKCPNCIFNDPEFTDTSKSNFSIPKTSKATNANTKHDAYQVFYDRYGIDIYKDIKGRSRTLGINPDIGAYEAAGILKPPSPTSSK